MIAEKQGLHLQAGNAKLVTIAAALVMAWLVIYLRILSPFWLLAPIAIYIALAIFHERVNRLRSRAERSAVYYQRGLARIENRWAGGGETGERFRTTKSIYAEDLDLFGRGSLFELLSTARTPMGESWLARWLLKPSSVPEILERQEMVAELRDKLELREALAVIGGELRADFDPEGLTQWAGGKAEGCVPGLRRVFAALANGVIFFAVLFGITNIILPLLVALSADLALTLWFWKTAKLALSGLVANDESLVLLARILNRLENEPFVSPRLRKMIAELKTGVTPASTSVEKLARLVSWANARDSLTVRIFDIPLMYTMQLGFAAEAWRRRYGRRLRSWLDAIGEMEAVLSLATYFYEHPEDPFPTLVGPTGPEPLFAGEELGHPLISSAACIRNSVRLTPKATQVLMVSGSNMSGKSTLLRAVGINAVLAMAGAPVRAKSLTLTPLALGTSIRTTDSLQEGRSGFYTEILRLREVFELTEGGTPVLFLFDELFGGTNSTDRMAGAEGLLRELMLRGAIGIVTTHDLALTAISPPPSHAVSISNAHFQEWINDGRMTFDFKLRPGPVEKGNALQLMRMIGLEV
ncbi:MAG TPA: mismatch repair protein [Terriglobia bacterium]|nr:mismatch repair protein [Terriglobia bacterium]